MPTLRQLRYFLAVARHRHFGRAAQESAVSQPALSVQIQELEAKLGVSLIERRRGDVTLTPAGLEVARRARRLLIDLQDLIDGARRHQAQLAGPLRLGVIPSIAPYLLPVALPALHARYPRLDLQLRETVTNSLLRELADGELDVLLMSLPVESTSIETMHLFDDRFILAAQRSEGPGGPALVTTDILKDCNLLLLEEGHCLREQALTYCQSVRPDLKNQFGATSLATIMQLVANGYGATLLPEISIASEMRGKERIGLARFVAPEPKRAICLAWRRSSARKSDFVELGRVIAAAAEEVLAAARQVVAAV